MSGPKYQGARKVRPAPHGDFHIDLTAQRKMEESATELRWELQLTRIDHVISYAGATTTLHVTVGTGMFNILR